jgi:hypothetical protein
MKKAEHREQLTMAAMGEGAEKSEDVGEEEGGGRRK